MIAVRAVAVRRSTEVDVSDPSALRVVRTLTLDGSYLAARMVGGTVRIVATVADPGGAAVPAAADLDSEALAAATRTTAAVLALVARRELAAVVPDQARRATPRRSRAPLVQCRNVRRPVGFSGLGMLTVLTVDLAKGLEPVDSTAVMTDGRIVYASQASALRRDRALGRPARRDTPTAGAVERRHDRDPQVRHLEPDEDRRTSAAAACPGYLLSQWSLSEFGGVLRVVSTDDAGLVGRGRRRLRVVPDDAAPGRTAR